MPDCFDYAIWFFTGPSSPFQPVRFFNRGLFGGVDFLLDIVTLGEYSSFNTYHEGGSWEIQMADHGNTFLLLSLVVLIASSIYNAYWLPKTYCDPANLHETKMIAPASKKICAVMGAAHLVPSYGAQRMIRVWCKLDKRSPGDDTWKADPSLDEAQKTQIKSQRDEFEKLLCAFQISMFHDAMGENVLQAMLAYTWASQIFTHLEDENAGMIPMLSFITSVFAATLAMTQYACHDRSLSTSAEKGFRYNDGFLPYCVVFIDFFMTVLARIDSLAYTLTFDRDPALQDSGGGSGDGISMFIRMFILMLFTSFLLQIWVRARADGYNFKANWCMYLKEALFRLPTSFSFCTVVDGIPKGSIDSVQADLLSLPGLVMLLERIITNGMCSNFTGGDGSEYAQSIPWILPLVTRIVVAIFFFLGKGASAACGKDSMAADFLSFGQKSKDVIITKTNQVAPAP